MDSLDTTVALLMSAIKALARYCWPYDRIHLFGFSDGGTVALEVASRCVGACRLGGCVTVTRCKTTTPG